MASLLADPDEGVRLGIERDGKDLGVMVIKPEYLEEQGIQRIGIRPPTTTRIGGSQVVDGRNPVEEAGLKPGDRILRAGYRPRSGADGTDPALVVFETVQDPEDFQLQVDECAGRPLTVEFERTSEDGSTETATASLLPARRDPEYGRWFGLGLSSNRVKHLRKETWLGAGGLREGDRLLKVGDRSIRVEKDATEAFEASAGKTVEIVFQRESEDAEPRTVRAEVRVPDSPVVERVVVFAAEDVVNHVVTGYPAERIGIARGDKLVSFGGDSIGSIEDLSQAVVKAGGKPVSVAWLRDGETLTASDVVTEPRWDSGIAWQPEEYSPSSGPLEAISLGTRKSVRWVVRIYMTLGAIASRRVAARHLGGPITIGRIVYAAASGGMAKLVYYMGMISINLGLINLLPIPILDGGHLVFAGVEKAIRRPVGERIQAAASYVGLALILALVLFTTWNDIWRLFGQ
jgi:regulator of sigma E protease